MLYTLHRSYHYLWAPPSSLHYLPNNKLEPGTPLTLGEATVVLGTDNAEEIADETTKPIADIEVTKLATDPDTGTVEASGSATETEEGLTT